MVFEQVAMISNKEQTRDIKQAVDDIAVRTTGLVVIDDDNDLEKASSGSYSDSSGTEDSDSDYDSSDDDDSLYSSDRSAAIEGMEELEKELEWLKPKNSDSVSLHSTPTFCYGGGGLGHRRSSNKGKHQLGSTRGGGGFMGGRGGMVRNSSAPSLPTMPLSLVERMAKADSVIGQPIGGMAPPRNDVVPQKSPQEHLEALMKKRNTTTTTTTNSVLPMKQSALELEGFFIETTEDMISSYDAFKARAIREDDADAFRYMHAAGETLQCCNRFGESIVHAGCRRASMASLTFLLNEANVSLKVMDDSGRTPLHDACWTNKPVFELIELVLNKCPELFFIADKRGSTPLEYVRKEFWGEWRDFLDKHQDKLLSVPRVSSRA